MQEIRFTCRTITPLVMTGADGKTPELRPPGIKASLRYWWRALHGHLSLNQLREFEGEIFGNNSRRSNLLIKESARNNLNSEEVALLPHKEGKKKSYTKAFSENQEFDIQIYFSNKLIGNGDDQIQLNREYVRNLFILTCILGGWGKRSRRGFGSTAITRIDNEEFTTPTTLNEIYNDYFQNIVQDKFRLENNKIIALPISKNNSEEYPRILAVQIGQQEKNTENIGEATHKINKKYGKDYSKSVGAGRPRLASPIYISILENEKPIITTLKKESWVDTNIQTELKDLILQ